MKKPNSWAPAIAAQNARIREENPEAFEAQERRIAADLLNGESASLIRWLRDERQTAIADALDQLFAAKGDETDYRLAFQLLPSRDGDRHSRMLTAGRNIRLVRFLIDHGADKHGGFNSG